MTSLGRTEDLFHRALQCGGDVDGFLLRECGEDAALMEAVKSLIIASGSQQSCFLSRPLSVGTSLKNRVISTTSNAAPRSGDLICNYRIKRPLGQGGMGTVYLAEELEPVQRSVALKLMNASWSASEIGNRFAVERQVLASLNHPRIPTIYNAGTTSAGQTFLVLEYVDGKPIVDFCREQKADVVSVVGLFEKLCNTVGYIHEAGIIHRDIKSGNVLVSGSTLDNASPVLVDFGIARTVTQHDSLATAAEIPATGTQHGDTLGTPGCMSPEQYLLGFAEPDHRSDVYSLGLLLYRLLTDSQPFSSSYLDQSQQIEALSIVPSPAERVSLSQSASAAWPASLDQVVLRCLKVRPEERYQSAAGIGRDLRRVLSELQHPSAVIRCDSRAGHEDSDETLGRVSRRRRGISAIRKNAISLIAAGLLVALSPALNVLDNTTDRPMVTEASQAADLDDKPSSVTRQSQTVSVDAETYGLIASILSERGLAVPSRESGLTVESRGEADVEVTMARHSLEKRLPVASDTSRSSPVLSNHSG